MSRFEAIIDSLILPKVLDLITATGGSFRIKDMSVGQGRTDPSHALIEVAASSEQKLADVLPPSPIMERRRLSAET